VKIWNLNVSQTTPAKGADVQIHGVIDGGWLDDQSTSTAEIAKALAEHQDAKHINVRINSVGGSLFGGVALYNLLEAHGADVTSYVDGLAASAASIIAMAGKTVMGRGAMLMIHNPLAVAVGDAAELRKTAAVLDKARDSLLAIYKAKTGKDGTT
jgi:ATP-dependent Clp protease protease subunit